MRGSICRKRLRYVFLTINQGACNEVELCYPDKFVRESEPVPDLLAEIVQRLSQDGSLSVKNFVPDPATLLGGHSVTFPSSNEVVEPLLGVPMRSRHFSKPPLPRQNSSASALSPADLTGDHPTESTMSGTEMALDRGYPGQGDFSSDQGRSSSNPEAESSWVASKGITTSYDGEIPAPTRTQAHPSDAMDVDDN